MSEENLFKFAVVEIWSVVRANVLHTSTGAFRALADDGSEELIENRGDLFQRFEESCPFIASRVINNQQEVPVACYRWNGLSSAAIENKSVQEVFGSGGCCVRVRFAALGAHWAHVAPVHEFNVFAQLVVPGGLRVFKGLEQDIVSGVAKCTVYISEFDERFLDRRGRGPLQGVVWRCNICCCCGCCRFIYRCCG